ncbi:MAG: hypothetical protein J6F30_07245 [Cellulosilyticum sp.]|nr:hypothetical protein [Cellulosilyticum sp.]
MKEDKRRIIMKSRKFIAKVAMFTLVGTTVLGSGAALFADVNTAECVVYTKKNPIRRKKSNKKQCQSAITNNACKPNITVKPGCGQGSNSNTNNNGNSCGNTGNSNGGNNCGNTDNNVGNSNNGNTDNNVGNGNNGNTDNNVGNNNNGNTDTGNNGNNNQGGNGSTEEKPEKPDSDNTNTQKSFEDQVLVLVNKERANYGLSPLTMDESLRNVARIKSTDMYTNKYFDHTSPTYGSPFEMLKTFGIKYSAAAENIAQGYQTPEAVVKGWMNSPGHRANILNGTYKKIGIGYEANGNYWTQLFTS